MLPGPTIEAFDTWLAQRSLGLSAIVIGGSALALLGITDRQTRDCDILHPELPEEVAQAAREFAAHQRGNGVELGDDWFNNGPIQLARLLPEGWQQRVRVAFAGTSLRLMTLGRDDLLKTKLFALCDRGSDLADCIAMAPTAAELELAEPWLAQQDANPLWPDHVRDTLGDLRKRLGDGV